MAFIEYGSTNDVDPSERIPGGAHIMRIHGVRNAVMRKHFELYRELMYGSSALSCVQREMIATVVSAANGCDY